MKIARKIWVLPLLLVLLCICLSGCSIGNGTSESKITSTTDISAVENLFPALEGSVVETQMEQVKYGSEDARSVPGPSDYEYRGYAVITEEAAQRYSTLYKFDKAEPQISFDVIKERAGQWGYSYDFGKEIVPAGYIGNVWLDGNVILFEIGTM